VSGLNPPAFPRTGEGFGNELYDTPGMSLRDWFAGQALIGYLAANPEIELSYTTAAARSFAYADAMISERKRGQ
jgi:hypothetical protein